MKKYLNSNLFYQGDSNIFLSLCIVYIASFILNLVNTNQYFSWEIKSYLYNQMEVRFTFSYDGVALLILYIGIVYAITVGLFKRKKWATFLAGPFSRIDIRARELLIIIFSIIVYVVMYSIIIIKNYIQYYDILIYINDFNKIVVLDIFRIISISIFVIGIIAILDSIFANLYYLVGAGILSLIYLLFLINDFSPILTYYTYDEVYGLRYVYNGLFEYLSGTSIGNSISTLQIICTSSAFILIGIILIYISKILTNKMLVENMNEGIMFDFPKKVANFMIITFAGVVGASYISSLINDIYFRYTLGQYEVVAIRLVAIVIISIISNYVLKNFKKVKKDVYY